MAYTFTINGTDFSKYVASGGIKWTRNDVEASDAGRTLDGTMVRGRVATKIRLDVTCRPLKTSEISTLLTAIQNEYVTVSYTDPQTGGVRTGITMYSNNNPASYLFTNAAGQEWWQSASFPLIEV